MMLNKKFSSVLLIPGIVMLISCGDEKINNTTHSFPSISDISDSGWQKLSRQQIIFGHQSVGSNIIDGIKRISSENTQAKISILETEDPHKLAKPGLTHFWVGENTRPLAKLEGFAAFMKKAGLQNPDIAFFKFCYVDITADTDVEALFKAYETELSKLISEFPKTQFIHVTAPITCMPKGFEGWKRRGKNLLKKVMGKPVFDLADNSKRHRFNELLRNEYSEKFPVFDLAKIESTLPGGKQIRYSKNGKDFYSLVADYTYDGGHLNEYGRKKVAEQLLIFLARLSK
jgi:hypothetical protein